MKKNTRAQSSLEMSVLLVLVTVALLVMYGYLKRSVQGNWKVNADTFSDEQFDSTRSTSNDTGIEYDSTILQADIGGDDSVETTYRDFGRPARGSGIRTIDSWGVYNR